MAGCCTSLGYLVAKKRPAKDGERFTPSTSLDLRGHYNYPPSEIRFSLDGSDVSAAIFATSQAHTRFSMLGASDIREQPECADYLSFLRSVDGIVFLVDAQRLRASHNKASLDGLLRDLKDAERDPSSVRIIFQLNKRDLDDVLGAEEMRDVLDLRNSHFAESVAISGAGVEEAFDCLIRMLIEDA